MLASSGPSALEDPSALGMWNALQLGVILEQSLSRLRSGNVDARPTFCHGSPRDRWKKGNILLVRVLFRGPGGSSLHMAGSVPLQFDVPVLAHALDISISSMRRSDADHNPDQCDYIIFPHRGRTNTRSRESHRRDNKIPYCVIMLI